MSYQHQTSSVSIMPPTHLALWRHLDDILSNELIVAGSFAVAQMRDNLSGDEMQYNDIDYWYDETEGAVMTLKQLESYICTYSGVILCCSYYIIF